MIITFMADRGKYLVQAHLLLASLRRFGDDNMQIIIGLPAAQFETLKATFPAYSNVTFHRVNNSFDDYPHANKIHLVESIDHQACVFLDTDILCLNPPESLNTAIAPHTDLLIKPADYRTWGTYEDWRRLYDHFGVTMPTDMRTEFDAAEGPPYYNAGFFYVADAASLGQCWRETALEIANQKLVSNIYPWLDQIALPLACARLDMTIQHAPAIYNYHAAVRETPEHVVFAHYHYFLTLGMDKNLYNSSNLIEKDIKSYASINGLARQRAVGRFLRHIPVYSRLRRLQRAQRMMNWFCNVGIKTPSAYKD